MSHIFHIALLHFVPKKCILETLLLKLKKFVLLLKQLN